MTTTLQQSQATDTERAELRAFLTALAHGALDGSLFELRERHGQAMRRRFIPVAYPDQAVSAILRAARERDVYLGAAPRAHYAGGRNAIAYLACLWVDADTPEAADHLAAFTPAPSILISTGRGQHAYWLLAEPVSLDVGEHTMTRLAQHLAADPSCTDAPRILRPPHTTNHGYAPPRPVELLELRDQLHRLDDLTAVLPEPVDGVPDRPPGRRPSRRASGSDPLLELEPAAYVHGLLGAKVGRDRKISCPFHRDEHPSLHVYPTAGAGWHCFSCGRGGTVYDLAAELWGLDTRGVEFLKLRALLTHELARATP